jgi:dephospho-CoA kinase
VSLEVNKVTSGSGTFSVIILASCDMILSANYRIPMSPCLIRMVGLSQREDGFMKRILLTGMSGTGKSAVIRELAARGYKAVDADGDEFSQWVEVEGSAGAEVAPVDSNRDWVWREDRMQDLLSTEDTDVLFVSGCAENMPKFFPQFDLIVLLSAPDSIIVERLRTRTTNQYGKRPDEVARVLSLVKSVEPRLRRAAGYEIDTSAPLEEVVVTLLRLV